MKYVRISPSDTLRDITERVGIQNVDQILADNGLKREPNVGKQWKKLVDNIKSVAEEVTPVRKRTLLDQFVKHSDIYEKAALSDELEWSVLSAVNAFTDYIFVSEQLEDLIPDSYDVLGNNTSISDYIRSRVNEAIASKKAIDSNIFSSVNTIGNVGLSSRQTAESVINNPMSWFKLPLDVIILYSSLTRTSMSIPAYPENGVNDSRVANYAQMPDLLYQYEPWQMYQSSGPRSNTYEFHLHRDMWTGNHLDGKANQLIRFCQAQCYPQYNGSAVITPTVTLYVAGHAVITGIMTQVDVDWSGPIGQDDWYLEFTLRLSITEVSAEELNYTSVLTKPLIG